MSDRPHPILEAPACPFVAFDDDRDRRSDEPDHRHRCFAELRPAPRALAHQHAYCLSSSFAACPTFQDWARREAAHIDAARAASATRDEGAGPYEGAAAAAGAAESAKREPAPVDAYDRESSAGGYPRDWAAPPAWLGGSPTSRDESGGAREFAPPEEEPETEAEAASQRSSVDAPAPAFLARRDRGPDVAPQVAAAAAAAARPPDPDRGFFGRGPVDDEPWSDETDDGAGGGSGAQGGRPRGDRRDRGDRGDRGERQAPVGRAAEGGRRPADDSPSWEPRRRVEAYPRLKTPMSLPSLNRLGLALIALLVAAVALFFVPMLLAPKSPGTTGGGAGETASPSTPLASASASASANAPSPSASVYVVKAGDTLSRIAARLGVPLDALIAANPQLKNPDKLAIGDQINIPSAGSSEIPASGSPSP